MRIKLVLTHNCNLRCGYCFAGPKLQRSMPLEVAYRALHLVFRGPRQEPVGVGFFGGEPMLEYERMVRIARVAVRLARRTGRRLELTMTSNATLLAPRQLDFLDSYGFYLALSVDGWGANHDRHRVFAGGRGSSRVVWRNLERAVAKLRRVHVMAVVNPDTVDGLVDLARRLYCLGLPSLSIQPNHWGQWSQQARERVTEAYERLADSCFASYLTDHPFFITPFAELDPRWPLPVNRCSFGRQDLAVSPLGHLYPCERLVGSDTREHLRIGTVQTGKSDSALDRLFELSNGRGGLCRCLALAPDAGPLELDNQLFFAQMAREVTRAALNRQQEHSWTRAV